MADVVDKAVSANDEAPGDAVVTADNSGTPKKVIRSTLAVNDNPIARLNAWYNGRIAVNPTYYG